MSSTYDIDMMVDELGIDPECKEDIENAIEDLIRHGYDEDEAVDFVTNLLGNVEFEDEI